MIDHLGLPVVNDRTSWRKHSTRAVVSAAVLMSTQCRQWEGKCGEPTCLGNREEFTPPPYVSRGACFNSRDTPSTQPCSGGGKMGGYSSTPRKAKVSEEGGDESLYYAASGMQVSFFREQNFPKVPAATPLLLIYCCWVQGCGLERQCSLAHGCVRFGRPPATRKQRLEREPRRGISAPTLDFFSTSCRCGERPM